MSSFDTLVAKVEAGERISEEEAFALYRHPSVHELGWLANVVRERKNGNVATYVINQYLNYSNICVLSCQFCAFAKRKRDSEAFEYAIDEMAAKVREAVAEGVTEIHVVGGLHPTLPFSYYTEMLRELKRAGGGVHLKAFTAIEIRHLAHRVLKASITTTLETLREAGLDALTGGGAEIFDPEVRDQICRGKETAEEWLEVHRIWHEMGMRSTCTMLYGHVETVEQRIAHMGRLRDLQDATGGFTGFVPYAFEPENNRLSHLKRISAVEELRTLALARIFLDNIDHLTGYWISMGLSVAQVALSYGVDDLHGTIMEEKIFHMAGAKTPLSMTRMTLERVIREAGREPRQRDTFYRDLSSRSGSVEAVHAG